MAKGKKSGAAKNDNSNGRGSISGYRAFIAALAGEGKYGGKASLAQDTGDGVKDTLTKEGACFDNDAVAVVRDFATAGVIAGQTAAMTADVKKKSSLGTKDGRLSYDDSALACGLMLGLGVTVDDVTARLVEEGVLKSEKEREKEAKERREESIAHRSAQLFVVIKGAVGASLADKTLTPKDVEKVCDDVSADVEDGNVKTDGAQAAALARLSELIKAKKDQRGVGKALEGVGNGDGK